MPKRRNLNGLPHNLTKSYFGTMRYHGGGYMADWLLSAARDLNVDKITIDVLNSTIDPKEMENPPLLYHLRDLKNIITKELAKNGFAPDFIIEAKIRVEIPEKSVHSRTLYCYPELMDIEGRRYKAGRIIETAYEQRFDLPGKRPFTSLLFSKVRKFFKPG